MANQHGGVGLKVVKATDEISHKRLHGVGLNRLGSVAQPIAAHINGDDLVACLGQRSDLVPPGMRQLRPAVHHDHQGAFASSEGVQANAVGGDEEAFDVLAHDLLPPVKS